MIQTHKLCFNRSFTGLYSSTSKSSTPPEHILAYSGMPQNQSGPDQSYEIPKRLLGSDLHQWFSTAGVSEPTFFLLS